MIHCLALPIFPALKKIASHSPEGGEHSPEGDPAGSDKTQSQSPEGMKRNQSFHKKCLCSLGRIFFVYGGYALILVWTGCSNLFFYPDKQFYGSPAALGIRFEQRMIVTPGQPTLMAWRLFPAEGQEYKGIIIHLHGNAENMSTHFRGIAWLLEYGYQILTVDYRGYGGSEGVVSIDGIHEDVRNIFRHVQGSTDLGNVPRFLLGQSLGGTLASTVAGEAEFLAMFDGIIIESAFSGYRSMVREKVGDFWLLSPFQYPLSWLVTSRYKPQEAIAKVDETPFLFFIAELDQVVPPYQTLELYNAVKGKKELVRIPYKKHLEVFQENHSRKALVEFLEERSQESSNES